MKIEPRRAGAFLREPGGARVVLLYGEDEGLVRSRADALTRLVAGAADDPFRVSWLGREEHGRLEEESSAIAMLGGRRVVRVREAGDALTPVVERVLAGAGDSLVVLEAGALPRRSKLLGVVEAARAGAALTCYPEEGDALRGAIAAGLEAGGVHAAGDALDWLRDHLGGDYASTRGEIEKLILYAGAERTLDLDAARACVGDQAATSMDDAAYWATLGNIVLADRAVERAFAEGMAPVGLLRGLLGHLVRMHQARGRMEGGASANEAVDALRPPVFWKRKADMVRVVSGWPAGRIAAAVADIRRAELACKQTGAPDGVIARRLVMALARQGPLAGADERLASGMVIALRPDQARIGQQLRAAQHDTATRRGINVKGDARQAIPGACIEPRRSGHLGLHGGGTRQGQNDEGGSKESCLHDLVPLRLRSY